MRGCVDVWMCGCVVVAAVVAVASEASETELAVAAAAAAGAAAAEQGRHRCTDALGAPQVEGSKRRAFIGENMFPEIAQSGHLQARAMRNRKMS